MSYRANECANKVQIAQGRLRHDLSQVHNVMHISGDALL